MTQQEQARLQVLNNLLAGYMTTEQAAILMGLSARHTRRILAAYREKGAAAIAHGNRGRSPANATASTLAIEAVRLARTRYAGVNHTHLSELLREREGIEIGRDTLRRILTNAGVSSPRRRRPPKHRVQAVEPPSRYIIAPPFTHVHDQTSIAVLVSPTLGSLCPGQDTMEFEPRNVVFQSDLRA